MPGSTGPDLNTYTIPEVQLGDTFNVWRDASNTAIYKLNKLKIYDADISAATSIGATYTNAGVWTSYLLSTVTTGHTFSGLIQFTGGISASAGFTLGSNAWVVGGVSLGGVLTVGGTAALNGNVVLGDTNGDTITVNGLFVNGLTATGAIRANAGLTASQLDVSGVSKFVGSGSFVGGLSASALYASTGSTFASTLYVTSGATFAGTTDYVGVARFNAGITASALYASTGSTFASNLHVGGGFTANGNTVLNGTLYVAGSATLNTALVVNAATQLSSTLNVVGASTLAGTTASTLDVSGVSKFVGSGSFVGGLSASALYASTGSTFGSTLGVLGSMGATSAYFASNVGVGITVGAMGRRILGGNTMSPSGVYESTAKLEVRGDICIPSGGFFVSKNMTIPALQTWTIAADENAFFCGTLTTVGTLTIVTGGRLLVL